jgi:hypothetical protein
MTTLIMLRKWRGLHMLNLEESKNLRLPSMHKWKCTYIAMVYFNFVKCQTYSGILGKDNILAPKWDIVKNIHR